MFGKMTVAAFIRVKVTLDFAHGTMFAPPWWFETLHPRGFRVPKFGFEFLFRRFHLYPNCLLWILGG